MISRKGAAIGRGSIGIPSVAEHLNNAEKLLCQDEIE
jgi:hypothetical protein